MYMSVAVSTTSISGTLISAMTVRVRMASTASTSALTTPSARMDWMGPVEPRRDMRSPTWRLSK